MNLGDDDMRLFFQKMSSLTPALPNKAVCILPPLLDFHQSWVSWQKLPAIICVWIVYNTDYKNPIVLEQKYFPSPK